MQNPENRREGLARGSVRRLLLVALAGGLCSATASAQSRIGGTPVTPPPSSTNPGQPAAPSTPGLQPATPGAAQQAPLEPGPYVQRLLPKDWNLDIRLRINATRPDRTDSYGLPVGNPFSYKTVAVVFPEVLRSASHDLNDRALSGEMRLANRVVSTIDGSTKPFAIGLHSGTNLLKFEYNTPDGKEESSNQVWVELHLPVTCYQTKFDEAAAMKVDWPKGDWPKVAKSTFEPQMFVDKDAQGMNDLGDIQAAVKRWLSNAKVADAKSVPPVRVAKIITGGVVSDLQPSSAGETYARTGEFEGYVIRTPSAILKDRRGNEAEIVKMLVLGLRTAGIPARLVFGQEAIEGGDNDKNFLTQKSGGKNIRVWAEFCLYDEVKNTVNWVPIDVIKLRKSSSRPPGLEREWRYFGTHDSLNVIVPFSFTFHPPMPGVQAYDVPGFYGWVVGPTPPQTAYQMLSFTAARQSKTADKNDKKDGKSGDNRRPK